MSYIEREAVHKLVRDLKKYRWTSPVSIESFETVNSEALRELIDFVPTADVVEVRHGEWVKKDLNNPLYESKQAPHCSICGEMSFIRYKYCPDCGAKMDGGERRSENEG